MARQAPERNPAELKGTMATPAFTQQTRLLWLETPLGDYKLLLRFLSGQEAISQLFCFHLDLLSEDGNIQFGDIVGQNITIGLQLSDGVRYRHLNGHVSRFVYLGLEQRLSHYQAEMVPWVRFLTRTADCRIFQNKSAPDIIEQVFKDFGFRNFEFQLQRKCQPRDYCVQYRETACNFVMRLLEEEGIFFFFRHERGKHTLVMADAPWRTRRARISPRSSLRPKHQQLYQSIQGGTMNFLWDDP